MIYLTYLFFTIITAIIGNSRKIGSLKSFLISLLLSPLVGLIFVFASEKKSTIEFQDKLLNKHLPKSRRDNTKQLEYLESLFTSKKITKAEYINLKNKILEDEK